MILDFKGENLDIENELPETKTDERTGIEYHLEGEYYKDYSIYSTKSLTFE